MKTLTLTQDVDIAKLLAFIRANARGVKFELKGVQLDEVLRRLQEWAEERQLRVRVKFREADTECVVLFGVGGMVLGAAVGGAVGGLAGMAVGAAAGAVAGAAFAHVELQVLMGDGGLEGAPSLVLA